MSFDRIVLSVLNANLATSLTLTLPVQSAASTDQYVLKGADGLGPPEIDVFINNKFPSGGTYLNRHIQNRQVVLRVGLNPNFGLNQTASQLRSKLYAMLGANGMNSIGILIYAQVGDEPNGLNYSKSCNGHLKRIEIVPFSKDPEVQLTFDCYSPYLLDQRQINMLGVTKVNNDYHVDYYGTAPIGCSIVLLINQNVSELNLHGRPYPSQHYQHTQIQYPFLTGDLVYFNSSVLSYEGRNVSLYRPAFGATINLNSYLTSNSEWFELYNGPNVFHFETETYGVVPDVTLYDFYASTAYFGV